MNQVEKQSEKKIPVSRTKVGILTMICWLGALSFYLFKPEAETIYAGFVRVGLLMSAVWIAFPSGKQEAAWAGISVKTVYAFGLIIAAIFLRVPVHFILIGLGIWWVIHYVTKPFTDALKSERRSKP